MSERRIKTVSPPGGVIGNLVFEQVEGGGGETIYAVCKDGKTYTQAFLNLGNVTYMPLTPSPWILPPPPIEYGGEEELWREVKDFLYEHIDLSHDVEYDILTGGIHESWTMERWDSTSYIWFHGPPNSGKTRGLDLFNLLCFRALMSPSISAASVYRAIDMLTPTFLLDEFELYHKDESKREVVGVLNAGYRRGQVVLRTDKVKDGAPILRGFKCFGFKAISSIEDLPHALASRCIRISMSRAVRKVRPVVRKDVAKELRGKLLMYRFRHFNEPLETENPLDLPDGRLIELYTPLVYSAPNDEIRDRILIHAEHTYKQSVEEDRATFDARVFIALLDSAVELEDIKVSTSHVAEKLEVKPTTIGRATKRLGFNKAMDPKTRRSLTVLDLKRVQRLASRYLLPEEKREHLAAISEICQRRIDDDVLLEGKRR